MLDVMENLDTVNYIIQEALTEMHKRPLTYRSGLVNGDGYALDFIKGAGKVDDCVRIRTDRMQNLCQIYMNKNEFILRYTHKFHLKYKLKTGIITCNWFDDPFTLDEMAATFFVQSTIGFGLALENEFNFDTMIETINMCRSTHENFLSFIQTKSS